MWARPCGSRLSSVANAPGANFSPVWCPHRGLGHAALDSDHAECELNFFSVPPCIISSFSLFLLVFSFKVFLLLWAWTVIMRVRSLVAGAIETIIGDHNESKAWLLSEDQLSLSILRCVLWTLRLFRHVVTIRSLELTITCLRVSLKWCCRIETVMTWTMSGWVVQSWSSTDCMFRQLQVRCGCVTGDTLDTGQVAVVLGSCWHSGTVHLLMCLWAAVAMWKRASENLARSSVCATWDSMCVGCEATIDRCSTVHCHHWRRHWSSIDVAWRGLV